MATLLLSALISLVILYALVLFVRNAIISFRLLTNSSGAQNSGTDSVLCKECAILHGKRLSDQQTINEATTINQSKSGDYLKCSECSIRFNQSPNKRQQNFHGKDKSNSAITHDNGQQANGPNTNDQSSALNQVAGEKLDVKLAEELRKFIALSRTTSEDESKANREAIRQFSKDDEFHDFIWDHDKSSLQTVCELPTTKTAQVASSNNWPRLQNGIKTRSVEKQSDNPTSDQVEIEKVAEIANETANLVSSNWRRVFQVSRIANLFDGLAEKRDSNKSFVLAPFASELEPEEPELLITRKLRSAEVQM